MTNKQSPIDFARVDQTSDPAAFIEFLDARKTIEGEREVKELVLSMLELRAGSHVLEIGCGTGDDAREMAKLVAANGRVVGIDLSETMLNEARRRAQGLGLPVEFARGDVRRLDFAASSFDCAHTDRVLIFVAEIEKALAEIVRVLRPKGRLVASELDHELHFIDSPAQEVTRRMLMAFADAMPQPRLGRQLPRLFKQAGLQNVQCVPRVLHPPYPVFERVYGGFLRAAIEKGQLPQPEVTDWLGELDKANAKGVFYYGAVVFTVRGEKPS